MNYKKLDYVMDLEGFISMIIYNSHPENCIFISPKYFPCKNGSWTSSETGKNYERFEYYWNLKNEEKIEGSKRVYEVDNNPNHQYRENVLDLFELEPINDPCHGVPMYCLPRDHVAKYYDANEIYRATLEKIPRKLSKFSKLLDIFQSRFAAREVGITGSYLYGLHQEFSDLNLVIYDSAPIERFHDTLMNHGGMLEKQEIPLTLPGTSWEGWLEDPAEVESPLDLHLDTLQMVQPWIYRNRFIGSIHEPGDRDTRLGFWLANKQDVLEYGAFTKKVVGVAVVKVRTRDWTSGMASGNFTIDNAALLGFSNQLNLNTTKNMGNDEKIEHIKINSLQVIGEYSRMFIFNEEIVALGLLQEITINDTGKSYHELLVGGRELGGWIVPLDR